MTRDPRQDPRPGDILRIDSGRNAGTYTVDYREGATVGYMIGCLGYDAKVPAWTVWMADATVVHAAPTPS